MFVVHRVKDSEDMVMKTNAAKTSKMRVLLRKSKENASTKNLRQYCNLKIQIPSWNFDLMPGFDILQPESIGIVITSLRLFAVHFSNQLALASTSDNFLFRYATSFLAKRPKMFNWLRIVGGSEVPGLKT